MNCYMQIRDLHGRMQTKRLPLSPFFPSPFTLPRKVCNELFNGHKPNTASRWNSVIRSHVDSFRFDTALSLFLSMLSSASSRSVVDHFTLPLVIRAASAYHDDIRLGQSVHCLGLQLGFPHDVYFCNALVHMYAKSGRVDSAHRVFDEMRVRDVVSWTSLISGCVRARNSGDCFALFRKMRLAGVDPNSVTLAVVLKACGVERDECGGRQLHCLAIKRGSESDELVANSILNVFSRVGDSEALERFFSFFERRSVVSWNVLMSGYLAHGEFGTVVQCFEKMWVDSVPSHETLTLVVSAVAKGGELFKGCKVHGFALKSGQIDRVLEASLIDFYVKCRELASAILLFREVETSNCVAWNVMMSGFIQNGQFTEALDLYRRMQELGHEPSPDTLRVLILLFTQLGALRLAKQVHGYIVRNTLGDDYARDTMETSILNMYAKCGSIILARRCFIRMVKKDVVAWSSMMEGYATHGIGFDALELFYRMEEEGIKPNSITFLSLLSACSHSGLVREGVTVFDNMSKKYGIRPELNHYTCMVDLFGRSGELSKALKVINNMKVEPDARIWGALLSSCQVHSDAGLAHYAAQVLFELEPDNVGYHVIARNIQVSNNIQGAAKKVSEVINRREKEPGWSCIEGEDRFNMFVAGDRSHPQTIKLYSVLTCLSTMIQEIVVTESCAHHTEAFYSKLTSACG